MTDRRSAIRRWDWMPGGQHWAAWMLSGGYYAAVRGPS